MPCWAVRAGIGNRQAGGTASANPTFAEKDEEILLTASPNSGYAFKEWQIVSGGKLAPTATTTRAQMAQVLYGLLAK